MSVKRIDSAVRIDGVKRLPSGGLRVDAALARSGILKYRQPDGSWISEYVPPTELSRADSLSTLASAPVTKLHPPEMITKRNWSKYARGTVGEQVRVDDGKVVATVYLQDADLADAVERGDMREMSCGYLCDLVNQAGVVPAGEPDAGQRYDRMQTNRVYNHAAVVPQGRAGREIALRLDADDNVIDTEEANMKIEKIDGVEYEVGSPQHKAIIAAKEALAANAAEIATVKADRAAEKARADAAASKLDAAEKAEKARLDAAELSALVEQSSKLLGDAKLDGKSATEIKAAIVEKAFPGEKYDASELGAFHKAAVRSLSERTDAADKARGNLNAAIYAVAHVDASQGVEKIDFDDLREKQIKKANGEKVKE